MKKSPDAASEVSIDRAPGKPRIDTGYQVSELGKVSAVYRQLRDLLFPDNPTQRRIISLDSCLGARYRDLVGQLANGQFEVHARLLPDLELDPLSNDLLKTCQLGGDLVGPDAQIGK